MVLAYQRELDGQKMAVICNLDSRRQEVRAAEEWKDFALMLGNYGSRERASKGEIYTLEPYELMVLGNM